MKHYFLILLFSIPLFKSQEIKKEIDIKQATVFLQGA